ncbi:MAG: hypothetical protein IJ946_08925 [Clostridia bacterium]|nr:hypothetical protein [Clostridia bacterium]
MKFGKIALRILFAVIVIALTLSILHFEVDYFSPDPPLESENLYDYTFKLDKKIYTLPFSFQSLTEDGWEITTKGYEAPAIMHGHQTKTVDVKKGDKHLTVILLNPTGDRIVHTEADVAGVNVYADSKVKLELPKNVTLDFTEKSLTEAYGEPSLKSTPRKITQFTYENSKDYYGKNKAVFRLFSKKKKPEPVIELYNAKFVHTFAKNRLCDEAAAYVAPKELSNDISSGCFELDGQLYQFPVPIKEFLDNGWIFTHNPTEIFSGGAGSVEITKSLNSYSAIHLYFYNPAPYMTTIENCMVYGMQTSISDDYSLTLPEGISTQSEYEKINELYEKGETKLKKYDDPKLSNAFYYSDKEKVSVGLTFNKNFCTIIYSYKDRSYLENYYHIY